MVHTCVRCGKQAKSIQEIHEGCPCGSKVFVFNKEKAASQIGGQEEESQGQPGSSYEISFKGKPPESYFARAVFSSEDVENIKIVSEGIFCVDVNSLSKNPVVLKDEEGVYYVKLPFEDDGKGKNKR
ncbi:MAG: hypothetical protein N3F07_02295 [Candidatus Micrarchaeota archaeon]|nr:hypothetical protein [Candidatus Micrarchaeota archaeon]